MSRRSFEIVLVGGLCLVLVVAPLPLGSNRDWAWGPLAIAVAVLMLIAAAGAILSGYPEFLNFAHLRSPAFLVAAVLLWATYQLAGPVSESWGNPYYAMLLRDMPHVARWPIALDVARGWEALMKLLTYLAVFWLAAALGADGRAARWILASIVAGATAYTGWALMIEGLARAGLLGDSQHLPIFIGLTGPFVNRSHYAAYAALAGLASLARVLQSVHASGGRGETLRMRWQQRLSAISGWVGLHFAAFVVLTTGVLMSWSRGAVGAYVVAIYAAATMVGPGGARRWKVQVTVVGVTILVVAFVPSAQEVVARLLLLSNDITGGRLGLWQLTLGAIADRPWLGWGLGSFANLYTVFQSPDMPLYYSRSHNTYLETAYELGIPAAVLFFGSALIVAFRCWSGVTERARDQDIPATGLAGALFVALQSLVDFSIQIPAVAVTFAAILGVAWAQSWTSRR